MKIKFTESTGCPYGQFVVYAETPSERGILRTFLSARSEDWRFWLHGPTYSVDLPGGPYSFNFGWIKAKKDEPMDTPLAVDCPLLLVFQKKTLFLDNEARAVQGNPTVVRGAADCLWKMACEDWDDVHLAQNGVGFEEEDAPNAGMAVVRYLQKTGWPGGKKKPIFRVHSDNIFVAHLMVKALQALDLIAVYEPMEDR